MRLSPVRRTDTVVSLHQQLQRLGQHLAEHLLGKVCREHRPQVAPQPAQEVEPHLHREGAALTLRRKERASVRGGRRRRIYMWRPSAGLKKREETIRNGGSATARRHVSVVEPPATLHLGLLSPLGSLAAFKS